jgi:hypothetical protein
MWLQACLNGIGSNPDFIEEKLSFRGCPGMPGDPRDSPLCGYLRQMQVPDPTVVRDANGYYHAEAAADDERVSLPVPAAVNDFLRRFDGGYYPNLVRQRAA